METGVWFMGEPRRVGEDEVEDIPEDLENMFILEVEEFELEVVGGCCGGETPRGRRGIARLRGGCIVGEVVGLEGMGDISWFICGCFSASSFSGGVDTTTPLLNPRPFVFSFDVGPLFEVRFVLFLRRRRRRQRQRETTRRAITTTGTTTAAAIAPVDMPV